VRFAVITGAGVALRQLDMQRRQFADQKEKLQGGWSETNARDLACHPPPKPTRVVTCSPQTVSSE
jgi:hypothetical protein